jgi:adenosylcobyric acid synthase
MGLTTHPGAAHPFARIFRRGDAPVTVEDGSVSSDGRVFGTYLHGIFDNPHFREMYLNRIRMEKGMPLHRKDENIAMPDPFDALAEHMEQHIDVRRLLDICGLG